MKVSFSYASDNSTTALNDMIRDILPSGVYIFPGSTSSPQVNDWITQVSNTYYINILPGWVVRGGGMTIRENQTTYSVVANTTGIYYVGLTAQYVVGGEPTLQIQCVALAVYNAWSTAQQNAFIIFAEVNVVATTVGSTTTYAMNININARTLPTGVFALSSNINTSGSTISGTAQLVNQFSDLTGTSPANTLAYIQSEGRLAIFLGGVSWIRVKSRADYNLTGSATFPLASYLNGGSTTITLPSAASDPVLAYAYANNAYQVMITPTSDPISVGVYWVAKNNGSFKVYCSGNSSSGCNFDWTLVMSEFSLLS